MNGNNEEDYEEWEDDSEPVYRSLSLGQATFGAQSYGDGFESQGMMSESMQTYDADEETPVYRSLGGSTAVAPSAQSTFGGFDMGMLNMGAHTMSQQKTAPALPRATNYSPVTLSAVPISTSFLDQCHVFAQGNKDEIAHKVSEFLKEWGVDFVFKDKKAKWKCVQYDHGQHVDFRVRLYQSVDHMDVYPLEFQRRQGPVLQFNRMYQNIIFNLSQGGFLRDPVRQPSKPLPMPTLPIAAPHVIDDGVERLVDMASTPMEDIKYQALVTLSKLSSKPEYQESLVRQAAAAGPTLRSCFSASGHVRRCAVTILADMCGTDAGQRSVAGALNISQGDQATLQLLFAMALGDVAASDMETRRQSCRMLARLSNQYAGKIIEAAQLNASATDLLVNCDSQSDTRLRKHLGEMKQALRFNGVSI